MSCIVCFWKLNNLQLRVTPTRKRDPISHSPTNHLTVYIFYASAPPSLQNNQTQYRHRNRNRDHCVLLSSSLGVGLRAIMLSLSLGLDPESDYDSDSDPDPSDPTRPTVRPRTGRLAGAWPTLQRPGSAADAGHLPPTLGEAQPSKCHHVGPRRTCPPPVHSTQRHLTFTFTCTCTCTSVPSPSPPLTSLSCTTF